MTDDPHSFEFDLDRGIRSQVVERLERSPLLSLVRGVGPVSSGIYALYFKGSLVYVGKASRGTTKSKRTLRARLSEHAGKIAGRRNIALTDVECRYLTFTSEWWVGSTVGQQMLGATAGQAHRMNYLCERLGLSDCPDHIHYQLLHRTVSALIEADRFHTSEAAMIVHSFSPTKKWFDAFAAFAEMLGADEMRAGEPVVIARLAKPLILGWAVGDQRFRSL